MKKSIVFITNSIGFAGAAKMLCFVAESLAERGHKVHICNLQTAVDAKDYERTLSEKTELYLVKSKNRQGHIREIYNYCKNVECDVIIGFTEIPNLYAKIVSFMLGIPSVMSERGDPARTGVGIGLKNWISFQIINSSKAGVFQTEGAKRYYAKRLQKKSVVIANPIFIEEGFEAVSTKEREKTVVSVGRFDNAQKRYDVMLEAFLIFSKSHPDYLLKLYGKGPDEETIRQWVEEKGLSEKVRFMGLTTDAVRDIAKDRIFLITSDFEGISNSLLEAMSAGLACVSTDHSPGGARLLIEERENGLLAPVGDAKRLALALCEFADNQALFEKCAENAKQVTERFAPEKIIDMWEQYIESIC